jgi:phage portal protein BeeE
VRAPRRTPPIGGARRSLRVPDDALVGLLDLIRPQPPLVSLLRLPPAAPKARAAVDFSGVLGAQLAATTRSWVPPRRGSAELLVAYAELPWLHAVVRRRAEALAQVEWLLWRIVDRSRLSPRRLRRLMAIPSGARAREAVVRKSRALKLLVEAGVVEMVLDHALLDLLDQPWPSAGSDVALWEIASKHQDLTGETLFALERDKRRRPVELLPVVPTWVRNVPGPGTPTFEIQVPRGGRIDLPVTEAVWIRQHDPADPFMGRGVGTAGAVADELETDEYMAATAKSRFFNRAIPEVVLGLLGSPPTFPPPGGTEIAAIAEDIENKHRGSERAGQLHLISGDFKAQHLGTTMVENQHVQGREFLRNTCMQIFGTPPEVLGVLDNANRSTIDAAAVHFATYSTVPMVERFRGALQAQLVPEYGADLVLDYVSPIPADREFERSVMVALPASFTLNEIRALAGRPRRDDGDEYYAAATGNVPTPGEKADLPEAEKEKDDEDDDDA